VSVHGRDGPGEACGAPEAASRVPVLSHEVWRRRDAGRGGRRGPWRRPGGGPGRSPGRGRGGRIWRPGRRIWNGWGRPRCHAAWRRSGRPARPGRRAGRRPSRGAGRVSQPQPAEPDRPGRPGHARDATGRPDRNPEHEGERRGRDHSRGAGRRKHAQATAGASWARWRARWQDRSGHGKGGAIGPLGCRQGAQQRRGDHRGAAGWAPADRPRPAALTGMQPADATRRQAHATQGRRGIRLVPAPFAETVAGPVRR
jgi:hypothetical protein